MSAIDVVVNVAAQKCTVTPINPINLSDSVGVLVDGTQNVTIKCTCMSAQNRSVNPKWFFENWTQVSSNDPTGGPFLSISSDKKEAFLNIPRFSDRYKGLYRCSRQPKKVPKSSIKLLLPSKIFLCMYCTYT